MSHSLLRNRQERTADFIEWLQFCFECKRDGRDIPRNINYRSKRGVLTDEYVERVVANIEAEFEYELATFSTYHYNRSGALHPPRFTEMSMMDKRAMVEGIDRVLGHEDN